MSEDLWYHRGREARANREPRDKLDGRMSPSTRAAFQRGWDDEDGQRVQISPEQRAESERTVAALKEWAAQTLGGPAQA